MIEAEIDVDLKSYRLWRKKISSQLFSVDPGPFAVVYKQWAIRYRSYIQLRFDSASKGDGTWPALSPKTIKGRRQNSSTILRDTGTLFAALAPMWAAPSGSINEFIKGGVKVGFGGNASHASGMKTIAEIAGFHQVGGGRLPKREIIVAPDAALLRQMTADFQRFLNAQ